MRYPFQIVWLRKPGWGFYRVSGGLWGAVLGRVELRLRWPPVAKWYVRVPGADEDPHAEVASFIQAGLGHSVDDETITKLVAMREMLQDRIGQNGMQLWEDKISREQFLSEFDEALKDAAAIGEVLLGFDDFHKIFGEFRVHSLGDTERFLAEGSRTE